jgi:SEC-C motif-containing protein
MQCCCGSQKDFSQCCGLYLKGSLIPQTPEQLMRSRFSAYCLQQIDYIFQTYHSSQQASNQKQEIASFAKNSHFLDLTVTSSSSQFQLPSAEQTAHSINLNEHTGYVEFIVNYLHAGKVHQFSEKSRFLPVLAPKLKVDAAQISLLQNRLHSFEVNTAAYSHSIAGLHEQPIAFSSSTIKESEMAEQMYWQWRYVDGELKNLPSKQLGRNDRCPCGSGLKFKQCHHHRLAGQSTF